jgi:hypothetical protein
MPLDEQPPNNALELTRLTPTGLCILWLVKHPPHFIHFGVEADCCSVKLVRRYIEFVKFVHVFPFDAEQFSLVC